MSDKTSLIRQSALALTAALLISGCTGKRKTPADTLVVALGSQPATLDPRFATDANGMRVSGLIFEALVRAGPGFRAEGVLAERWTRRGRVYTFFLRPNLRFHNGRPVTPEDIAFSFDYYAGEKSPFASSLSAIGTVKPRVENGRLMVEIELKNLSDRFLLSDLPAVKILPKEEVLQLGNDFSRRLIGTGPFKFVKEDLNEIRLESAGSAIKHLKFKVVRDDYTRFQKLLKGEVDFAQAEIPAEKIAEFERRPEKFNVYRYPGLSMTYLLINFRDPVLKRPEVRHAMAQALRREEIIRYKLNGFAREATSLLTPNNPYFNPALKNPRTDVKAARETVTRLGLTGMRLVLRSANNPQTIDTAKVLASQMSETGLNVDLESYEWGTFYGDVKKGIFQIAVMKWVGTVDPDIYRMAFHSLELPPGRNRGAYANPQLDRLLDQGTREEDPARRHAVFRRVQAIIQDDLAVIPLWYDEQVAVAAKNVLNFVPSLTSDFSPLARVTKQEP